MNQKHQNVPIWEKANLTLEEAAAFTNIGINKLRQLTDEDGCEYVLWIGSKRLIKRKKLVYCIVDIWLNIYSYYSRFMLK